MKKILYLSGSGQNSKKISIEYEPSGWNIDLERQTYKWGRVRMSGIDADFKNAPLNEHPRNRTPVADPSLSSLTCSSCQCSWRPIWSKSRPEKQRTRLPPRPPNMSTAARGCLHSRKWTPSAVHAGRNSGGRQRVRGSLQGRWERAGFLVEVGEFFAGRRLSRRLWTEGNLWGESCVGSRKGEVGMRAGGGSKRFSWGVLCRSIWFQTRILTTNSDSAIFILFRNREMKNLNFYVVNIESILNCFVWTIEVKLQNDFFLLVIQKIIY